MRGAWRKIHFFLRWGVYYNLELIWLQARVPGALKRGSRLPSLPRSSELDQRRRQAQLEIYGTVRSYGAICAACGNCCRERVDRFSVMDAAVRAGSDRPAPSFGTALLSPFWEVWSTLRHTALRLASLGRPKQALAKCETCVHLTPTGCALSLEDRPMICATWFCPKLMWAMQPDDLLRISKPLRVVELIQREAVESMREGG